MASFKVFSTICGLILCFSTGINGSSPSERAEMDKQSELFNDLFKEYHNQVTPVRVHNDTKILPLKVNVDLAMQNIMYMDVKSVMLVSRIWLTMNWVDHRLEWNTSLGIPRLHVDPSLLWKPDLALFNGELGIEQPEKFPILEQNGAIYWIPSYKATSTCSKDTRFFPKDTHTCTFKVGSWTHSADYMNLTHYGGKLISDHYVQHGDWKILSENIVRNDVTYPCCPETYIDVTFAVTIQRITHFYGAILVTPAIVISMALALVFGLPPVCHEKMIVLVGILISVVVLQFHLATVVSEATALGSFLLFAIVADLLIMAETTLVYKLFHRSTRTHPIPDWMRSVCMNMLPRVLCLTKPMKYDVQLKPNQNDCDEREIKIVDGTPTFEDTNEEWRFIARVVDRLSFCIFIFFYAIVTACIMAPAT